MAKLKCWNGREWVLAGIPKYWNGSSWVQKKTNYWNGLNWETLSFSEIRMVAGLLANGSPTFIKYSDRIEIGASGNGSVTSAVSETTVNLTGVSLVKIEWNFSNSGFGDIIFVASNTKIADQNTFNERYFTPNSFTRTISSIGVSNLSGMYFLRAHIALRSGSATANIYRIWLDDKLIYDAALSS